MTQGEMKASKAEKFDWILCSYGLDGDERIEESNGAYIQLEYTEID